MGEEHELDYRGDGSHSGELRSQNSGKSGKSANSGNKGKKQQQSKGNGKGNVQSRQPSNDDASRSNSRSLEEGTGVQKELVPEGCCPRSINSVIPTFISHVTGFVLGLVLFLPLTFFTAFFFAVLMMPMSVLYVMRGSVVIFVTLMGFTNKGIELRKRWLDREFLPVAFWWRHKWTLIFFGPPVLFWTIVTFPVLFVLSSLITTVLMFFTVMIPSLIGILIAPQSTALLVRAKARLVCQVMLALIWPPLFHINSAQVKNKKKSQPKSPGFLAFTGFITFMIFWGLSAFDLYSDVKFALAMWTANETFLTTYLPTNFNIMTLIAVICAGVGGLMALLEILMVILELKDFGISKMFQRASIFSPALEDPFKIAAGKKDRAARACSAMGFRRIHPLIQLVTFAAEDLPQFVITLLTLGFFISQGDSESSTITTAKGFMTALTLGYSFSSVISRFASDGRGYRTFFLLCVLGIPLTVGLLALVILSFTGVLGGSTSCTSPMVITSSASMRVYNNANCRTLSQNLAVSGVPDLQQLTFDYQTMGNNNNQVFLAVEGNPKLESVSMPFLVTNSGGSNVNSVSSLVLTIEDNPILTNISIPLLFDTHNTSPNITIRNNPHLASIDLGHTCARISIDAISMTNLQSIRMGCIYPSFFDVLENDAANNNSTRRRSTQKSLVSLIISGAGSAKAMLDLRWQSEYEISSERISAVIFPELAQFSTLSITNSPNLADIQMNGLVTELIVRNNTALQSIGLHYTTMSNDLHFLTVQHLGNSNPTLTIENNPQLSSFVINGEAAYFCSIKARDLPLVNTFAVRAASESYCDLDIAFENVGSQAVNVDLRHVSSYRPLTLSFINMPRLTDMDLVGPDNEVLCVWNMTLIDLPLLGSYYGLNLAALQFTVTNTSIQTLSVQSVRTTVEHNPLMQRLSWTRPLVCSGLFFITSNNNPALVQLDIGADQGEVEYETLVVTGSPLLTAIGQSTYAKIIGLHVANSGVTSLGFGWFTARSSWWLQDLPALQRLDVAYAEVTSVGEFHGIYVRNCASFTTLRVDFAAGSANFKTLFFEFTPLLSSISLPSDQCPTIGTMHFLYSAWPFGNMPVNYVIDKLILDNVPVNQFRANYPSSTCMSTMRATSFEISRCAPLYSIEIFYRYDQQVVETIKLWDNPVLAEVDISLDTANGYLARTLSVKNAPMLANFVAVGLKSVTDEFVLENVPRLNSSGLDMPQLQRVLFDVDRPGLAPGAKLHIINTALMTWPTTPIYQLGVSNIVIVANRDLYEIKMGYAVPMLTVGGNVTIAHNPALNLIEFGNTAGQGVGVYLCYDEQPGVSAYCELEAPQSAPLAKCSGSADMASWNLADRVRLHPQIADVENRLCQSFSFV